MNDTNWLLVVGAVVVGVAVGYFICYNGISSVPPYVNAGTDVVINECCSVQLTCETYDPEGGAVTYHWTAENGQGQFSDPNVLHPVYTAPAISGYWKDIPLTLTVTNSHGLSASDSVVVHVRDLACCPAPVKYAPAYPAPCTVVPKPAVPCCPPVPVPCPPKPVPASAPLPACYPATPVVCAPVPPAPPCITGSPVKSVDEGQSLQLHATVQDPDNNVISYHWTANKGTFNDPTSLDPIYTAPMVNSCTGADVCLTLTAVDSCCARGTDQIVLHVNNVNHPPIVNAGEELTVTGCGSVQLTCSASDPDGDRLTYHWSAADDAGSFSDPFTLHPLYTAPLVASCSGEDILLTLTVTDACGASTSDSMVAHVSGVGSTPPTVSADP